ncbi:hypothetical protein Mth01_52410 [Sphaerimonospora thailandensis]|uniref:Uncharacterized protein n=1 Tax=Sphaerimonospora thailandensis TaxID=795644 RepID=A0A8J3RII8_9ACTN|nr:hypothetical protein Mth01_52410 [Sphaerimonospora thailandensis]
MGAICSSTDWAAWSSFGAAHSRASSMRFTATSRALPAIGGIRTPALLAWVFIRPSHVCGTNTSTPRPFLIVRDTIHLPYRWAP